MGSEMCIRDSAEEGEGLASPLADLEQVVLTPHLGSMALETQLRIGERVEALISAFAEGRLEAETKPSERVL